MILLGFANGEDMANVQELVIGILQTLQLQGKGMVAFLKPYFEDLELIFQNGSHMAGFANNTFHLLLTGDVRKLLVGTKMIDNELLDR
jgi:hypothetical protein